MIERHLQRVREFRAACLQLRSARLDYQHELKMARYHLRRIREDRIGVSRIVRRFGEE